MTDDQHPEDTPEGGARSSWERLPQGDYDDGATAFVQLPEGGIDALLASYSPLAAPGHGYVPPRFTPAAEPGPDPAAGGGWAAPAEGAEWPDPNAAHQEGADDRFTYHPGATGQWTFEETGAARETPAAGHDVTGQWSIPVAGGDLPDESGEFSTSSLVEQWGGNPPATLPGGAPAPWATEGAGHRWPDGTPETDEEPVAQAPAEAPGEPSDGPYEDMRADGRPEAPQAVQQPSGPPDAPGPGETSAPAPAVDRAPAAVQGPGSRPAPAPEAADAPDPALEQDSEPAPVHDEHPLASYVLRVNGADRPVTDAWIGESLLYVLRERLGLAGAKDGCSQGECGACNVQVDGRLVASCLVPAVTAAGSEVRTVEGLAVDGQPSEVQRALARCGAVQCGFCVPGMAMTLHDLLEGNPAPTELEARQALCGNLCRCSGYRGVLEAVREVVAERGTHKEAESARDGDEPRIPHQAGPGAGGVHPSAFENFDGTAPNEHPYGQDGGQA
ncbi:(2Fe-2S)-binding protein [Streptomyces hygroscopicus]|uniref:2Fe-2S iron-sulfur cluster-binding protein n=1 Tax=Streptomyces hygroscopicus TaxID=1912 RepID=UPI00223F0554|nr:2Fe-2S iron-sulfur cluster-binding protein [Streptomyces hygroscopicus]MCW7946340.1 (2Fe-2S)-binding protein [Streptomyces hygroscopicus]